MPKFFSWSLLYRNALADAALSRTIAASLFVGTFAAFGFCQHAHAEEGVREGAAQALVAAARAKNLATEPGWSELLMVRQRVFSPPTSIVDSKEFFFSDPFEWSPEGELEATILAFARAVGNYDAKPDEHPACRFPARYHWLSARLPELAQKAPAPASCPSFDRWRKSLGSEKASIVFSSYFANNPSSMFGHSFLRLHRRAEPGRIASPMLDDTINFMAYPTTENPLLYALAGGFGGFPGRFSVAPFYIKIQEYNNAESRDLWEYELNLTREEIAYLHKVLWDLGPQTIDYFYFDENCSLVLLLVLDAVRPSLHLSELHPWVIPSDTLRAVARAPGLVVGQEYLPSAMSRFLGRYGALSADERTVVESIVADNDAEDAELALKLLGPEVAAAVIDAVIEFIDYDEEIAGTKEAVVHGELRKTLLFKRSELRVAKREVKATPPVDEKPDRGGGTTRLGGGVGARKNGRSFVELGWRPALHDLAEPDLGYSHGLAITFFDTVARYDQALNKFYFQRFDPLTILSAPALPKILGPFAWNLGFETENRGLCTDPWLSCFEKRARAGYGPVLTMGPVTGFALVRVEAGSVAMPGFSGFFGDALAGGALWPISPNAKLSVGVERWRRYGESHAVADTYALRSDAAFLFAEKTELRFSLEKRRDDAEAQLAAFRFF